MRLVFFSLFAVFALSINAFSQDAIELKNGELIRCSVGELNENSISFTENGTLQKLPLSVVNKVYYKSGESKFIGQNIRRLKRPFGIGAYVFGPTFGYTSLDLSYQICPQIAIHCGSDFQTIYTGLRVYATTRTDRLIAPYLGFYISHTAEEYFDIGMRGTHGYFPVGVEFLTKSGLVFSPEFAIAGENVYDIGPFFFGARIGYRFLRK